MEANFTTTTQPADPSLGSVQVEGGTEALADLCILVSGAVIVPTFNFAKRKFHFAKRQFIAYLEKQRAAVRDDVTELFSKHGGNIQAALDDPAMRSLEAKNKRIIWILSKISE